MWVITRPVMATSKNKALGRGLDALIQGGLGSRSPSSAAARQDPDSAASATPAAAAHADVPAGARAVRQIPLVQIAKCPWQPRRQFDETALQELAESIRARGVLQPVLLRKSKNGYELIAGERRLRAAQAAGLTDIPALVQEASDHEVMELALIENIQRADLNLIEEAEGYRLLLRQTGMTQEELAHRVGKARASITNALRLLELPDSIKLALVENRLSAGHAKVLLSAPPDARELLAARVIAQNLSVRALEKLVNAWGAPVKTVSAPSAPEKPAAKAAKEDRHLRHLADRMQQELGTKVELHAASTRKDGHREPGRLVIEFYDASDLNRLLESLNLGDLA